MRLHFDITGVRSDSTRAKISPRSINKKTAGIRNEWFLKQKMDRIWGILVANKLPRVEANTTAVAYSTNQAFCRKGK